MGRGDMTIAGTNTRPLRRGDIVEVRSAAEILATLDENGSLDGVPFMPEMLRYVGRRSTVSRRVEKICDTAGHTYTSRRVHSTVMLEDLRCDGAGHGGCQAGCRLYWKETWLRRVSGASLADARVESFGLNELERRSRSAAVRNAGAPDSEVVYRCQATEALVFSEPLSKLNIAQYAREVKTGNLSAAHVIRVLVREFFSKLGRTLSRRSLPVQPRSPGRASDGLGLQPGDLVRVRPRDEIGTTLSATGMNRGLWFDREMLPFCGGTYRVQTRVEQFIDEGSGRMVRLSSDAVILEGVVCGGECSTWRWFCPRGIYPFWREAWLSRVEERDPQAAQLTCTE